MKKTLIILDAGHGGLDARGEYTTPPNKGKFWDHSFPCHVGNRFLEGVFNRQQAALITSELRGRDFQVATVYDGFADTSLTSRTNREKQLVKEWGGPTLFLSVHANASGANARGLTLWRHQNSKAGAKLCDQLLPLRGIFESWGSSRSKVLYTANYHVLTYSASPACLLELGFFDQPDDAKLLLNPIFRQQVAECIARLLEQNYN